jgi:hypothetical protein
MMCNCKLILLSAIYFIGVSVKAQNYAQWPAEKPRTGFIENAQSKQVRLQNRTRPQVIAMQDKMRAFFNENMEALSQKTGWLVVELDEFCSDGNVYHNEDGTVQDVPFNKCPPGSFNITYQFIANKDSLAAWKIYQSNFQKADEQSQQQRNNDVQDITQSPKYKQYQDSAKYYMHLYTAYVQKHQDEGVALFTKDTHPKYYQQKQMEFMDKATALTDGQVKAAGVDQLEANGAKIARRFRNHSIVTVTFEVNAYKEYAVDGSLGPIEYTTTPFLKSPATLSKLYTTGRDQTSQDLLKWDHILLIMMGQFNLHPNQYGGYEAAFMQNGQSDLYTPKKVTCGQIQNICIKISGSKAHIQRLAALLDTKNYNNLIYNK